jgi:hypothetical protein
MREQLTHWNRQGVFIKPDDTEESYFQKIAEIQQKSTTLCQNSLLATLYDIEPSAVDVTYSNDSLNFWEAGCTWMEGEKVSIQLKAQFERKDTLFALYNKHEVLAHEYVHAVRYPLGSEKFEEFFAYHVSKHYGARLRAFLGPLFESPLDVKIVLATLLVPLIAIFFDSLYFDFFLAVPLITLTFFLGRLMWRWNTLRRCKEKLGKIMQNPLHLMVRMTDDEIENLSKVRSLKVHSWFEEQAKLSFRWKFLFENYIK